MNKEVDNTRMAEIELPTTNSPTRGHCAGLDVHQKTCDIALVDPEGKVVRRWHIKTCPQMLDMFSRELREISGGTPVDLGLEASTAGKAVFLHLRKLGLAVHMGHPRKLESILNSETKTDRNDAEELARLLQGRHFPESYVPTEEIEELRGWVRVRAEQVEKLTRVKQQVHALLVKHHLQHEAAKYSDIFGVQALHWLKTVDLVSEADKRQLQVLLEEGALLTQQITSLTNDLARQAAPRKDVELLQSIPGFDYVLALNLIAEVGDIRRFSNRKKFAAYCGVVPKNRDTGGKVALHAKVRHGNPRVKWALEIAVQANVLRIRQGRLFRIYEALKARVGVPKAMMAVAHRMAFVVFGVWTSGKPYEEGTPASFQRKRERLADHANAKVTFPSMADLVEKMLSPSTHTGVTS
jgi:transposase